MLLDIAATVGLDRDTAAQVLESGTHKDRIREQQAFWTSHGVSGVPSMVFGGTYLVTGAQGAGNYANLLRKVAQEAVA